MNISGYEDIIAAGIVLAFLVYMSFSDKFDSFTFGEKK